MSDIIPQKQCNKCPRILPLTTEYFHINKATKSGFKNHCKECDKIICKAIREKPHIKAKQAQRDKKRREAKGDELNAASREWYKKNREYTLEKDRQFRIDHPEVLAQRWQNWAKTEQGYEHCRIRVRNRQSQRKGAKGTYTYTDIQKQLTNQKGKCYYCGIKTEKAYHIDHVVPISRGGSNDPSNLVISCPTCNMSKRDKLPHEWPRGNRLM